MAVAPQVAALHKSSPDLCILLGIHFNGTICLWHYRLYKKLRHFSSHRADSALVFNGSYYPFSNFMDEEKKLIAFFFLFNSGCTGEAS